MLLLNNLFILN